MPYGKGGGRLKAAGHRKLSYERKKSLVGYGFISLWLIGFFLLYAKPLVESLYYTFNTLNVTVDGFQAIPAGFQNYVYAFTKDEAYLPLLTGALKDIVYQVPLILVFSLVMALLINQKFRGRTVVRAIFFLPVIIASGIVIDIINGDYMSKMILSGEKTSQLFQVSSLTEMLYGIGFSQSVVNLIIDTANNVFELSWKSGIQIILFLAGLQSVSSSLYEAASIDGGTKWEMFWKITFPMLTPILSVNIIYTITDNFTAYDNPVMQLIMKTVREDLKFHYSATLAWIYFVVVILILGVTYWLVNRRVVYLD